jgi:hypothetical protein
MPKVIDVSALLGGKAWYKSMTVMGLVLWQGVSAALTGACDQGLMEVATCDSITAWTSSAGQILAVLGVRRAATSPNAAS